MALSPDAIRLIETTLEAGIDQLEKVAGEGRYNTMCIRSLGRAAKLLGQKEVAERAVRLLRATPDDSYFGDWIVNFILPKLVPDRLRTLGAHEELEREHPPYDKDSTLEFLRCCAKNNDLITLCLTGKVQDACTRAVSGWQLEEVGSTLAVIGELDAALSILRNPALEGHRQQTVLETLINESFRCRRIEESRKLLTEFESTDIDGWWRIQLALGFAGREPWCGYPFSDY